MERVAFRLRPDLATKPALNVLLPALSQARMTGGPNTVLNLTCRAAARGVRVRYLSCLADPDPDLAGIRGHLATLTGLGPLDDQVELVATRPGTAPFDIGEKDVFCATFWPTAHIARKATALTRRSTFLYVIQDYEPAFYPWSTEFALAAETYSLDFVPIVNESFLLDFLVTNRIGRFADPAFALAGAVFEPAVDRSRFYPPAPTPSGPTRRLLFYARPSKPRNLFHLGLEALRQTVAAGVFADEPWELVSAGEDLPPLPLGPDSFLAHQPWLGYDGYAALLRSCDIVFSLMHSPHTSYPPLEAAACGATVVTNTFDVKTQDRLSRLSGDIISAPPFARDLAGALADARERVKRQGGARQDKLCLPKDWDSALSQAVDRVARFCSETGGL